MILRVLLIILLSSSLLSQAYGFENRGGLRPVKPKLSDCHYSDIYSSTRKSFVLYNILERIAASAVFPQDESEFHTKFQNAADEVKAQCGNDSIYYEKERLVSVEQTSPHQFSFSFISGVISASGRHSIEGPHFIELVGTEKESSFVYKKLYGNFSEEPLMLVNIKNSKALNIRIVGREKAQPKRVIFWYEGNGKNLISKNKAIESKLEDIKSLSNIYSGDYKLVPPKIKIGVVGTGVDYNQPGMAKHIAYRAAMEKDLIKIEALRHKIRFYIYKDEQTFSKDFESLSALEKSTGFPLWMDQALGTRKPADKLIANGLIVPGGVDHETRVTSRIISGGGPIEVFSVRRSMGSQDSLDVETVVKHFVNEGVRLVNLSFGSACGRLPKEEAAWEKVFELYPDVIFVVSAGNSGYNTNTTPFCPAFFSTKFQNVISVTALDGNGQLAVYNDTPVNFGFDVDLAIKSNNLPVLFPYRSELVWENNAFGATSLAAAEVSRIIVEAVLEGYLIDAQKVKEQLASTSLYDPVLFGVTKYSAEVDEAAFRASLSK